MIKSSLTASIFFLFIFLSNAQSDTLYTHGEKIVCSVKEVAEDIVKFSYPNEELINSVYKNVVQKIVFSNGRIQYFSESASFRAVTYPGDYEKVSIATSENEVKGLVRLGTVSSKDKAGIFSNQEAVKRTAYNKLKMQAAMQGANVILMDYVKSGGGRVADLLLATSETSLTGVAYASISPNFQEFKDKMGSTIDFKVYKEVFLGPQSSDISYEKINRNFKLEEIIFENGLIYVKGELKGEKAQNIFRVVAISEKSFTIYFSDGIDDFNYYIWF